MEGIAALHMMRKGQVRRLGGMDAAGQAEFVASLFGVAPLRSGHPEDLARLNLIPTTQTDSPCAMSFRVLAPDMRCARLSYAR